VFVSRYRSASSAQKNETSTGRASSGGRVLVLKNTWFRVRAPSLLLIYVSQRPFIVSYTSSRSKSVVFKTVFVGFPCDIIRIAVHAAPSNVVRRTVRRHRHVSTVSAARASNIDARYSVWSSRVLHYVVEQKNDAHKACDRVRFEAADGVRIPTRATQPDVATNQSCSFDRSGHIAGVHVLRSFGRRRRYNVVRLVALVVQYGRLCQEPRIRHARASFHKQKSIHNAPALSRITSGTTHTLGDDG